MTNKMHFRLILNKFAYTVHVQSGERKVHSLKSKVLHIGMQMKRIVATGGTKLSIISLTNNDMATLLQATAAKGGSTSYSSQVTFFAWCFCCLIWCNVMCCI